MEKFEDLAKRTFWSADEDRYREDVPIMSHEGQELLKSKDLWGYVLNSQNLNERISIMEYKETLKDFE